MYKIIEKGHKFKQTNCPKCECVFQFEDEDAEIEETGFDNQGVSWQTTYKLICPYCNKAIVRHSGDVRTC